MTDKLKIFYNGNDNIAAESEADAIAVWEDWNGELWFTEDHEDEEWSERIPDALTVITFDDPDDMLKAMPIGAEIIQRFENGAGRVRATWQAWADKGGRGLICSENW